MFNFNNYSAKSKFHDNSNALVVGKIKDEIASLPIKEFVGLMAKLYLCLVDDSSEHKKLKGENKNSVDKINHNCYNDGLLGEKYLRHSINRIQGKNRKMGLTQSKKIVCLALMIKLIFSMVDLTHTSWFSNLIC